MHESEWYALLILSSASVHETLEDHPKIPVAPEHSSVEELCTRPWFRELNNLPGMVWFGGTGLAHLVLYQRMNKDISFTSGLDYSLQMNSFVEIRQIPSPAK